MMELINTYEDCCCGNRLLCDLETKFYAVGVLCWFRIESETRRPEEHEPVDLRKQVRKAK
jgi:hypothetical protein